MTIRDLGFLYIAAVAVICLGLAMRRWDGHGRALAAVLAFMGVASPLLAAGVAVALLGGCYDAGGGAQQVPTTGPSAGQVLTVEKAAANFKAAAASLAAVDSTSLRLSVLGLVTALGMDALPIGERRDEWVWAIPTTGSPVVGYLVEGEIRGEAPQPKLHVWVEGGYSYRLRVAGRDTQERIGDLSPWSDWTPND